MKAEDLAGTASHSIHGLIAAHPYVGVVLFVLLIALALVMAGERNGGA